MTQPINLRYNTALSAPEQSAPLFQHLSTRRAEKSEDQNAQCLGSLEIHRFDWEDPATLMYFQTVVGPDLSEEEKIQAEYEEIKNRCINLKVQAKGMQRMCNKIFDKVFGQTGSFKELIKQNTNEPFSKIQVVTDGVVIGDKKKLTWKEVARLAKKGQIDQTKCLQFAIYQKQFVKDFNRYQESTLELERLKEALNPISTSISEVQGELGTISKLLTNFRDSLKKNQL